MSKTIKEYIERYVSEGLTLAQARNLTAQLIILSKIEKSTFVDKVLLKGGVVMYNMTREKRRTTTDLDFDFLRYDISSDDSIRMFVETLDKKNSQYRVKIDSKIEALRQQDYHGKRVKLLIYDSTESIRFKLDIGVHTLLAINQEKMCFSFEEGNNIFLMVNPPEQIFAEKLFSLSKIGPGTVRFKDVDDMYYLISNKSVDPKIVRLCLDLLTVNPINDIKDSQDAVDKAIDCLDNPFFTKNYMELGKSWMNADYIKMKKTIVDYLLRI